MLRSLFEFAYILYLIFISSISSVSFNDFCSGDLSCPTPLICSNTSQCICSMSSSFWNSKQNTCLSCPSGWIEWQNDKCLLFIEPSGGGVSYQKARNACLTHDAHLLHIDNHKDFVQLQNKTNDLLEGQYADAVAEFLDNGVWINFTNNEFKQAHLKVQAQLNLDTDWCEMEYENDISSWNGCVRVTKQFSKDENDTSLCLSYVQCNEKLSYICERLAKTNNIDDERTNFGNIERGFSALIGPIVNLAGSLFGSNQQPAPEPQQPQIQIISGPSNEQPQLSASSSPSSSNLVLYIVLAIILIVIIIVLLFCSCGGGFLFLHTSNKDSSAETTIRTRPRLSRHRGRNRPSTDSGTSGSSNTSN